MLLLNNRKIIGWLLSCKDSDAAALSFAFSDKLVNPLSILLYYHLMVTKFATFVICPIIYWITEKWLDDWCHVMKELQQLKKMLHNPKYRIKEITRLHKNVYGCWEFMTNILKKWQLFMDILKMLRKWYFVSTWDFFSDFSLRNFKFHT